MNDKKKKNRIILPIGCVVLTLLACVSMYIGASQTSLFELGEWPQETVEYRYALPSSAHIIEGQADVADIFGDYSMCASFTLPEKDLAILRQEGLNGFPPDSWIGTSDWYVGTLTRGQLMSVSSMLDKKPDANATYSYMEQIDADNGSWWRAIAINENSKVVYYCRGSV